MLEKVEAAPRAEQPAAGDDVAKFRAAVIAKLTYAVGKNPAAASDRDWFLATAFATRDRIVDRWITSTRQTYSEGRKRVYYLSLEFLIGRLLFDALTNLEMLDTVRAALGDLGVDLDRLRQVEPDAALGNGGLGRLAACFMESMATLSIAAYGYGIRYDHGLFRQVVKNGWQQEYPEDWLSFGNPGSSSGRKCSTMSASAARWKRSPWAAIARSRSGTRARRSRRWPTTPRSSAGAASM